MAFEWDPADRAAFDEALVEHIASVFPEVSFGWTECERRLLVTFPDGCVCSIWEPNFYFSYPSFSIDWIHTRAIEHIAGAHQAMFEHLEP
jgi:hypothetical protein